MEQRGKAFAFASALGGTPLHVALTGYLARMGAYAAPLLPDNPEVYWRCGAAMGFHSGLCELALRLLKCTASSADVESPGSFFLCRDPPFVNPSPTSSTCSSSTIFRNGSSGWDARPCGCC